MLSINTNLSSIIAQESMKQSTNKLNQAIERMSTGAKINHASDNAANYSISTNMTTKINSYNIAEDNAAMGLDMVTTISENLELLSQHAGRVRDLCEQAANGTYGEKSIQAIQAEIDSRLTEIERIKSTAEFNGIKLFKDDAAAAIAQASEPAEMRVTGSFIEEVDQLTEDEAIAQGYTIIKTADDLQNMQNNLSGKYILMNDIDLEGYNWNPVGTDYSSFFKGELNGNGFVIKNLSSTRGLFSEIGGNSVLICNLGVENATINGDYSVGILVSYDGSSKATYSNCYVTGSVKTTSVAAGGLIGNRDTNGGSLIQNCWADVAVNSAGSAGGLIGVAAYNMSEISNCYTKGSVVGTSYAGGLVGTTEAIEISDSYSLSQVSGGSSDGGIFGSVKGSFDASIITNTYWDTSNIATGVGTMGSNVTGTPMGLTTAELQAMIDNGILPIAKAPPAPPTPPQTGITLQVGINGDIHSQISMDLVTSLDVLNIAITDSASARDNLTVLDNYLLQVADYQTRLGAVQNRLESVLEEVAIQRDNLVSSRSTIRDADIAEVSSIYIQQQILQQASATLMATANQSPAIALQLI